MTLDIIVPRYHEPWETCRYLFDTIATQRGISFDDIRVIMVNDGKEDLLDEDNFLQYPFDVWYTAKEHEGVSAARNAGIDESTADIVMFCDADDGFLNNYGLHLIFSAAEEGFDMMTSCFIEEMWDAKKESMRIIRHDKDPTFIHGKAYRRQFLIDHNLRFDTNVNIHEDGYFNHICLIEAQDQIRDVGTPFYLWRWNDASTVRSNRENFVLKTYDSVMKARDGVCTQLTERGFVDDYFTAVCKTVFDSYYDFQKPEYQDPKNAKLVRAAEKEFKKFWLKYKDSFMECSSSRLAEASMGSRTLAYKNGLIIERTDLKSWLKHIEYEVK